MTIKFMTGVAGTLINIYRPDDLKTPIATVDAADDPEDMRGHTITAMTPGIEPDAWKGMTPPKVNR